MSRDPKVTVVVAGDPKGGKKAINEVEKALGGLGATGDKASSFIAEIQSRIDALGPVGSAASSGIADIVSQVTEMGPGAGFALAGVAALAAGITEMTTSGVHRFAELTGEARAYQRVSGANAQDSSRFASAMRALGIDVSTGTTAFARLSTNVKKHADVLAADGIEVVRDTKGHVDLTKTLLSVSDAYKRAGSAQAGNAIANDAFGRGYVQLLPLLQRGREGLEEFYRLSDQNHETFSQSELDRGREYKLAIHELDEAFGGLELELGEGVIPLLTGVAHAGAGTIHFVDDLGHSVDNLAHKIPHIGTLGRVFAGLATAGLSEGARALAHLGSNSDALAANLDGVDTAASQAAKALDDYNKAVNSAESVVDRVLKAQTSLNNAKQGEVDADRAITDAKYRLTQAYRSEADAAHGVAVAQHSLDESGRQVEDAVEREATAREHLADVMAHEARNRQRVELQAKEGALGVVRAQKAVTDAQRQRSEAAAKGDGKGVADADLAIQEALLGVQEATLSQSDAQEALDKLNRRGARGSEELQQAQDDLTSAEQHVRDAVYQHGEAERQLHTAQQNVIDQHHAVVAARDDIAASEGRLATAKTSVADAAVSLKQAQDAENAYIATGSKNIAELVAWLQDLVQIYPEVKPILDRANQDLATALAAEGGGRSSSGGGGIASRAGAANKAAMDSIFGHASGGSRLGSGYRAIEAFEAATGIPFRVTSTTGGTHVKGSLHYKGKAVDMVGPNMMAIFNSFLPVQDELAELFYTPAGFSIKNGRRVPPIAAKDHYSHVHVATYDRGGILPPGITIARNLTGRNERVVDPQADESAGSLTIIFEMDGKVIGRAVTPHVRTGLLRLKGRNPNAGLS